MFFLFAELFDVYVSLCGFIVFNRGFYLLMSWYQRRPTRQEDWWMCSDWFSYGQSSVQFIADIQFEYFRNMIYDQGAQALSLAHTQYENDPPTFMKFLSLFRFTHPDISNTRLFRHLVHSTIRNARQRQEEERRIMAERMTRQRFDNNRRQPLPARTAQQGRL